MLNECVWKLRVEFLSSGRNMLDSVDTHYIARERDREREQKRRQGWK